MGLLSKLKSLLGVEEESRTAGSDVDVTVERDPSAESERAVKEPVSEDGDAGTDESDTATDEGGEAAAEEATEEETTDEAEVEDDEAVDEPVATETDASASTESLVDEEHTDDPTRAAEPAEAAGTGGETVEQPPDGEPVSSVKGIGPAYAGRLKDAGVETVAELAAADPEELAEQTDLSPKRVGRWVDSAQDHE